MTGVPPPSTMWFIAQSELPYHADPDYQDAVIFAIRSRLGDVRLDITHLATYGQVGVDCASRTGEELSNIPIIRSVSSSIDRGIIPDAYRTFI